MNSILSIGTQGLQAGIGRVNQAAGQVARLGNMSGSSDLATAVVDMKANELQVKASASVIKTGDEMLGTLIDIRA